MRRNYLALLVWAAVSGTVLAVSAMLLLFPGLGAETVAAALILAAVFAGMVSRRLHRDAARMMAAVERLPEFDQSADGPGLPEFRGLERAFRERSRALKKSLAGAADARRELEALLDSMQDAVVAVDAAGRIQWTNERMQRAMAAPAAGISGRGAVRVGHALVQTVRDPDVLQCVRLALESGTVSVRRATSLVPGRQFEVNASPMPGGGAVAVLHDITRVEEVERTQRDFVANVSHELRTPLTSITGYVETLLDHETLSDQAREFLLTILKNATRMNRLTEDLLVMARVESPAAALHPAPVAADALVRDAVRSMSGLVQENRASLEIGQLTATQVFADPDAVMQVLGNLIENAIKYGQPRGDARGRVIVGARDVPEPREAVEFSVQDFGAGIASEHLNRIFERFYRIDKTRSRESGGTGLGLAIARRIVQLQGGTIRAESAFGAGSTFAFTLPKALDPARDAVPGGATAVEEVRSPGPLRNAV